MAVASLFTAYAALQAQSPALVIRNVTLIDGTGAAAQPGTTVVVTGNRITAVGRNAQAPQGAQVIDGSGKFLMPGLWDVHVHPRGEITVPRFTTYGDVLLLANGVTGVRIMAGGPQFQKIQKAIAAGEAYGPRIEMSSRNMDGLILRQPLPPKFRDAAEEAEEWRSVNAGEIPRAFQITNAAQAKAAATEAKASGIEFVKIHNELTPEAYFAIAAEAKAQGLYLTGHVPTGVSVTAMSDTGARSIEHWGGMLEACSSREDELLRAQLAALALAPAERGRKNLELRRMALDSYSAEKCAALAAHLKRNNTWLSPTFMPAGGIKVVSERGADLIKYVPNPLRGRWQQQAAAAPAPVPPSAEDQELAKRVTGRNREIVLAMKRGGVQFVVGTDSGGAWRIPGRSLHEGLLEMTNAGLTPAEVIVAATSSSAQLLKREKDVGTVHTGKLADFVLLDANPLDQIGNARRINAVVANGRLYDRKTLDDLLAQLASTNATN